MQFWQRTNENSGSLHLTLRIGGYLIFHLPLFCFIFYIFLFLNSVFCLHLTLHIGGYLIFYLFDIFSVFYLLISDFYLLISDFYLHTYFWFLFSVCTWPCALWDIWYFTSLCIPLINSIHCIEGKLIKPIIFQYWANTQDKILLPPFLSKLGQNYHQILKLYTRSVINE